VCIDTSKKIAIGNVEAGVFLTLMAYTLVWISFMRRIGFMKSRQALKLKWLSDDLFQDEAYF